VKKSFPAIHISLRHLVAFLKGYDQFLLLNNEFNKEGSFRYRIGAGCSKQITKYNTNEINAFLDIAAQENKTVFCHLTYPLKNQFENLSDRFEDFYQWPLVHFFVAENEITISGDEIVIVADNPDKVFHSLIHAEADHSVLNHQLHCIPSVTKEEYIQKIEKVIHHIQRGDIYEMNFCFPFEGNASIDPYAVYQSLCKASPAPFSCFYRLHDNYLLCSSPERFIRRTGNKIISQPIKGTSRRGKSSEEDELLKAALYINEKERSENVMIVDLVRNDLSRIAESGSVKVEELCGIYSFPAVHQLISTVAASVKENVLFTDILRALFPMGSMTGAPKISAMNIINELENFNRGLYSGSVGYIKPDGDFDFNVVIRSILYHDALQQLSIPVGSAITAACNAEEEYEECLLKAKALLSVINPQHKEATAK
jgi:para-aminobenzoate synthetase component 1